MRMWFVTGGHPFEREPLLDAIDAVAGAAGAEWQHLEQPTALDQIQPGADVDTIVFYDMPGLRFTRDPADPLELIDPPDGYLDGLGELLAAGVGMVFLHHAIASWPSSERFAELVGGRFHYQPGSLRGAAYPDSGYRFDVAHTVDVIDHTHPICEGLPASFELTDELYQFPVLADRVTPLMRTTASTTDGYFSADLAIRGSRNDATGWSHPPGSDLVAWTTEPVPEARLVYLQFGDGPVTYADPVFRQVLANAVTWAGSRAR